MFGEGEGAPLPGTKNHQGTAWPRKCEEQEWAVLAPQLSSSQRLKSGAKPLASKSLFCRLRQSWRCALCHSGQFLQPNV